MDIKVILAFALPSGLVLVAITSALALAKVVSTALNATARQPEAANKTLINMAIGCAFIEAITIYVLVFAFVISGKF